MSNAPLPGQPNSRITSAALCPYRSHNSTARLRCSLEYLATMTTPPAQGVQHFVTTPSGTLTIVHRHMTPVWAFMRWPGLGERQYANFDVDDEDGARAWLREAKLRIDARAWQPEREEQCEEERSRLTFGDYFPTWLE